MSFKDSLKNLGDEITSAANEIKDTVVNKYGEVKQKIDDVKSKKKLESDLKAVFEKKCQSLTLVRKGTDVQPLIIKGIVNYIDKSITVYGDIFNLKDAYFIDSNNDKLVVSFVRSNQKMNLVLDNTLYERQSSVVEFTLENTAK